MAWTRRFTILHSNDMHGDFLAEQAASGGELIGGLPFLEWPLAHQNVGRKIEDRLTYGS